MGNYVYAYQGEAISNAIISYNNGRVLSTPTRQLPNVAIHFKGGIMGPVCLYNSAEEICAIFKAAHLEKEGRAPSYRQASDLITFLHLWRKHKSLEVSDLMKVAMKQWRPPIWASEKAKKKKEHLHDEKRQAIAAETVVPPPPAIIQVLQERITFQPMSPSGNSNSTPGNDSPANLLARIDEQPAPPLPKAKESSSCSWGPIVLNLKAHVLPRGAPSFDDPIDKWVNFIEKCQAVCPLNSCGGLRKMFPGTVRCNIYPDNKDSDLNPPSRRQVQGFIIMERLAPIPCSNFDRMVWVWGLVRLLMVPGWYRYLLDWAAAALLKNGTVAWLGQFNNQATMTDITAYIATNGVMVHDTNDAVVWAQTAAWEMIVRIEDSRGFTNSSTSALDKPIRQELSISCSNDSLNRTKEWYEREAISRGQPLEELPSTVMNPEVRMELDALQQFGKAASAYNIIPVPTSGGNVSEDVALKEDSKLPEGPAPMWGNEEGRYILHNFTYNLLFRFFRGHNPTHYNDQVWGLTPIMFHISNKS